MATDLERGSHDRIDEWRLWFGLLGAVGAWIVHLMINYFFVPFACDAGLEIVLYLTALGTMLVAVAALAVAGRSWRRAQHLERDNGIVTQRVRFMALSGILLSALFLFVIFVQSLPIVLQNPCEPAGSIRV